MKKEIARKIRQGTRRDMRQATILQWQMMCEETFKNRIKYAWWVITRKHARKANG